jgi:hypothetical protein
VHFRSAQLGRAGDDATAGGEIDAERCGHGTTGPDKCIREAFLSIINADLIVTARSVARLGSTNPKER